MDIVYTEEKGGGVGSGQCHFTSYGVWVFYKAVFIGSILTLLASLSDVIPIDTVLLGDQQMNSPLSGGFSKVFKTKTTFESSLISF